MPRLSQVSRDEVTSPRVRDTYAKHFGDRDPVAEPGTDSGTPGTWWTVFAQDPELFELMLDRHAWQFSAQRALDPGLRELALARAGWSIGSIFVYTQHCKLARRAGVADDVIDELPSWSSGAGFSAEQRVVLGYTDDLVSGSGRVPDSRFDALRAALGERAILELTFMVTTYVQSAVMCKALRLEWDDLPDPVVDMKPGP